MGKSTINGHFPVRYVSHNQRVESYELSQNSSTGTPFNGSSQVDVLGRIACEGPCQGLVEAGRRRIEILVKSKK